MRHVPGQVVLELFGIVGRGNQPSGFRRAEGHPEAQPGNVALDVFTVSILSNQPLPAFPRGASGRLGRGEERRDLLELDRRPDAVAGAQRQRVAEPGTKQPTLQLEVLAVDAVADDRPKRNTRGSRLLDEFPGKLGFPKLMIGLAPSRRDAG
jgi:hypothetical protein